MNWLSELTDIYGQRLTGSREYYEAAKWIADEMKEIELDDVHFENYCSDCRGWSINSFNLEMVSPNYMHLSGYPLAMTKSTNGIVSGEVISIASFDDLDALKKEYSGKIRGKIILLGEEIKMKSLQDTLMIRFSKETLAAMDAQLKSQLENPPLPELLANWATDDRSDKDFLAFLELEGALAVINSRPMYLGVFHPDGTYYYKNDEFKPLPYFTIMPEHFNRLYRMIKRHTPPILRINLKTEFYNEPQNNVNIIGEITGNDPELKSEEILIGAHFDSWHAATGATDNGVNCIVLLEAIRILKQIGYQPKRTIKIGLWGGEEQSYLGSLAYAKDHFGDLNELPNAQSKKVSAYLNLDEGAGSIR
ncbi:M28 family peptidase, partial [Fulvivirga lutimaris]|uniref:M28 family peptidase n=1 Tax=Fulvivirga lutimaris TaxID=1819566 RepID=UPI001629A519